MSEPLQPRQFEQLPMFMSGREIADTFQAGEGDKRPGESSDETFGHKFQEARHEGLADQIATEGVKQPIEITHEVGTEGRKQILDGHHRAAVARVADPDRLVPVLHHETEVDAVNPKHWRAYPNL